MRLSVVATALCLCIVGLSAADEVHASIRKQTDIPAEGLGLALQTLAKDRNFQIVYVSEEIANVRTPGAVGEFTPEEALKRLLTGTGLTYRYLDDKTVTIFPVGSSDTRTKSGGASPQAQDKGTDGASSPDQEGNKSTSSSFRVAQVDQGANSQSPTVGNNAPAYQDSSKKTQIEEIVVTAQKRSERIQDVPISISAVTSEDIARRGLVSSEDYLRGIPGVNATAEEFGQTITIRGIETSPQQQNFTSSPTVATYFGETPTTSTAGEGGGTNVDLKLVDIERVEVLRGPQGTAFGNSSLGGAVRTIPVAPKLDSFEAKMAANDSETSGTGGNNYMVQGVVNIPVITDKLAVRAVAYQFDDSGFYRNVAGSDAAFQAAAASYGAQSFAVDQNHAGRSKFTGGRIAAQFQATDDLKFTVSYLTQKTFADSNMHAGGETAGGPYDRPYNQAVLQIAPQNVRGDQRAGFYDSNIDLANATMGYDLSWADLVATLSYIRSGSDHSEPIILSSPIPWSARGITDHHERSGEIRLTTKLDGPWNFLAGLYAEKLTDNYTEHSFWYGTPDSEAGFLGVTSQDVYLLQEQRSLKQKAAFGEVSWKFMPEWTLTGGVRYYDYNRTDNYELSGAFGSNVTQPNGGASGTIFRGNLSYKPNDDTLLYASFSQGFRLGTPQAGLLAGVCDRNGDGLVDGTDVTIASTKTVKSDKVNNYELGSKFTLLDRRLTIAADVFRIDWTNMPFRELAPAKPVGCGLSFEGNASAARSQGVEFQATFYVTSAFRVDVGSSFIDAKLTENAPLLSPPALRGDRLPGSPKVNSSLSFQYEFNISGYNGFVRADSIYEGALYGNLQQTPSTRAGDYVKLDTTAHVSIRNFGVELFVHNLTNSDAFTWRGVGGEGNLFGYRLRPRTVGVQFDYNF
jgi:iron complex outermembrane receptor protein